MAVTRYAFRGKAGIEGCECILGRSAHRTCKRIALFLKIDFGDCNFHSCSLFPGHLEVSCGRVTNG